MKPNPIPAPDGGGGNPGGGGDHPGYTFLEMTDNLPMNAKMLDQSRQNGFTLEGFWRDFAVFSKGY